MVGVEATQESSASPYSHESTLTTVSANHQGPLYLQRINISNKEYERGKQQQNICITTLTICVSLHVYNLVNRAYEDIIIIRKGMKIMLERNI